MKFYSCGNTEKPSKKARQMGGKETSKKTPPGSALSTGKAKLASY